MDKYKTSELGRALKQVYHGKIKVKDSIPSGFLNLMPVDRYIYAPSKWIITFIGGDATKPRILARYPEDAEEK